MHLSDTAISRRRVVMLLLVASLSVMPGCATLAHRSSYSYPGKQAVTSCDGKSTVCPWLVGDAVLLLPGVVPGVIAFAVDFGTGAWRHDEFAATANRQDDGSPNLPLGDRQSSLDAVLFEAGSKKPFGDAGSLAHR